MASFTSTGWIASTSSNSFIGTSSCGSGDDVASREVTSDSSMATAALSRGNRTRSPRTTVATKTTTLASRTEFFNLATAQSQQQSHYTRFFRNYRFRNIPIRFCSFRVGNAAVRQHDRVGYQCIHGIKDQVSPEGQRTFLDITEKIQCMQKIQGSPDTSMRRQHKSSCQQTKICFPTYIFSKHTGCKSNLLRLTHLVGL